MVSDYEGAGIPYDSAGVRIDRLTEALAIIKRLFAGGGVSFTGKHYSIDGVEGAPRPVQKPHPPIVVAAVGTPASFEWTGRQGYRLMVVPYLSSFEALRRNLALYREAFAGSQGRAAPPVQLSFHMHVAETDARAVAEATPQMDQYVALFKASASAWQTRSSSAYPGYAEVIKELDTMTMERVLREQRAFVGAPDAVAELVRGALGLFGDVEPSLSLLWGNFPYEQAERSLRLFASDVMPRFAPEEVRARGLGGGAPQPAGGGAPREVPGRGLGGEARRRLV